MVVVAIARKSHQHTPKQVLTENLTNDTNDVPKILFRPEIAENYSRGPGVSKAVHSLQECPLDTFLLWLVILWSEEDRLCFKVFKND